jgi:hypothetical protein
LFLKFLEKIFSTALIVLTTKGVFTLKKNGFDRSSLQLPLQLGEFLNQIGLSLFQIKPVSRI